MCKPFSFFNHELWSKQLQKIELVQPCILQMEKLELSVGKGFGLGARDRQDSESPDAAMPQPLGATFQSTPPYSPFGLKHNQPLQLLPQVAPRLEWEEPSALH